MNNQPQDSKIADISTSKKVRSTEDILNELVSMFYKVDKSSPGFASIVMAGMTAAGLNKEANNARTGETAKNAGEISAILNLMGKNKDTPAQVGTYTETVNQMSGNAKQLMLDIDKVKLDILSYITKQHTNIPLIIEKIKQGDTKNARQELDALVSEGETLLKKTRALKLDTERLEERQTKIFQEMYNLLPLSAKKGVTATPTQQQQLPPETLTHE